jgi:hypothetical protein
MTRPTFPPRSRVPFSRGLAPRLGFAAALLLGAFVASPAQTPAPSFGECKVNAAAPAKDETPAAAEQTSGLRIEVKGADGKPLRRVRFYLLTRGVQGTGGLDWAKAPERASFLKDASPKLREVLEKHDCDTLYCAELISEYPKLVEEVPEFRQAFQTGLRKYNNRRLALDWLMVNFPRKDLRTGYYESKRAWLRESAARAGAVASVMTNEEGEAIFTRVKLGDYHVSNLIPVGAGRLVWDCAVKVPPPSKKELHSASVVMSAPKAAAAGAASK